jgi:preprotein translocase subunit SecA
VRQDAGDSGNGSKPAKPTRKFNALGILEDIPSETPAPAAEDEAIDIAPDEPPKTTVAARKDPVVIGAGRPKALGQAAASANVDWSSVGRNDPCPCGSGKKFKKCHGATL